MAAKKKATAQKMPAKKKPMTGGTSGSSNAKFDRQTVSRQMSLNRATMKTAEDAAKMGYAVGLEWEGGLLSAYTMGDRRLPSDKDLKKKGSITGKAKKKK